MARENTMGEDEKAALRVLGFVVAILVVGGLLFAIFVLHVLPIDGLPRAIHDMCFGASAKSS